MTFVHVKMHTQRLGFQKVNSQLFTKLLIPVKSICRQRRKHNQWEEAFRSISNFPCYVLLSFHLRQDKLLCLMPHVE